MPVKTIINKAKVPIKIYTEDIDSGAIDQLIDIAQLPFIHSHIAAMPDVHLGIGATVGSVIPSKGAIIPAAVGVDIGCFIGDTKVPLIDGTEATLKELVERGGEHWIYTIDNNQQITAAKATAKLTRKNATLMKVVIDNDHEIICTPDHKFMLRDGTWCEAQNLKPRMSLMPFYSRLDKDGYKIVRQPATGKEQRFHWAVARSGVLGAIPSFKEQKTVIHHIDFNQSNNHPKNLHFMGDREHSAYHRSIVKRNEYWQSADFEKKRKAAIAKKAKTKEGYEYFAKRGTENITRYMRENPEHFKAAVAGNGKRGRTTLIAYNKSEKGRAKSRENAQRLLQRECECPNCGEKFQGHLRLSTHKRWVHQYNHKVKSVEHIDEREDVYCLTVPEYQNFALSAGIFVHNCGMNAIRLSLNANDLPDNLKKTRLAIEETIPVGFDMHKSIKVQNSTIKSLHKGLDSIVDKHPAIFKMLRKPHITWSQQLATLGGGNHFIEICLDENQAVWVMLHSGSRGIGNVIGRYFINLAKKDMEQHMRQLPHRDLAYFTEGAKHFDDYVEAVHWAQDYALSNRREMMRLILDKLRKVFPNFEITKEAINCHHNYVSVEEHFGEQVYLTRKGAISANQDQLGIIPGSMGAKSYIVRGKGNAESFCSCSHGAGRKMSRSAAKKHFNTEDVELQTEGVECRKDKGIIDEIPSAYKSIDEVMANQTDLVEIVHTLKQVVCVKG